MRNKKMNIALFLLLLALCLGACSAGQGLNGGENSDSVDSQELEELSKVEEITAVLDADGLRELDRYPNLRMLDVSGSEDYNAILAYMDRHPQVQVRYTVPVCGTILDNSQETLTLTGDRVTIAELEEKLQWLPALRELYIEDLNCKPEDLIRLRESYPSISISYDVRILGTSYPETTENLDLCALGPEELEETAKALQLLPQLHTVELTDAEGNNLLSLAELARLQELTPQVLYRYRFVLFGQELSTEDERIEYIRVPIGEDGAAAIREALPCLSSCRYFLLDDCGLENETLAQLRADFPNTKIVWRVHISYLDFLTDVKVIHLTFLLTNDNAQVMRYCNEVEYLDIGHNTISDITFMGYMPHLKYVILSYNKVSDLSPLSNCKELEMLELYQCLNLEDISPLAECESLKLLNVSWTDVKDITPVYGLKNLERFYCIWDYEIPQEQMDRCFEELPNCWITFEQLHTKNVGWSFDADGGIRAQWYLDMYQILRYRVEDWFFGDYPEGWNQEEHEH